MEMRVVVFDGPEAPKRFACLYEGVAIYRAGKDRRSVHASLIAKLDAVSEPRPPDEQPANNDLVLRTLTGPTRLELEVRERDMAREAVNAVDWPGFALAKVQAVVDLLENADRP